jgi:hypothetical protein
MLNPEEPGRGLPRDAEPLHLRACGRRAVGVYSKTQTQHVYIYPYIRFVSTRAKLQLL